MAVDLAVVAVLFASIDATTVAMTTVPVMHRCRSQTVLNTIYGHCFNLNPEQAFSQTRVRSRLAYQRIRLCIVNKCSSTLADRLRPHSQSYRSSPLNLTAVIHYYRHSFCYHC